MVKLNTIVRFLNKELNTRNIPDSSRNGLQVRANSEITKVGFAVDACISTFEKAKKAKCDLIVIHHGLLWKGKKILPKLIEKRVRYLKKNKISLYASHLPLDLHPECGNNMQLAKLLNLNNIRKFGTYHKIYIGYSGKTNTTIKALERKLNKELKTKCLTLNFGKSKVKSIGIVSGGGKDSFPEAYMKKLDCFLLGEANHRLYHQAKDLKQNVIIAGHYETETVGVKALMPVIKERFKVQTYFIDNPTGGV